MPYQTGIVNSLAEVKTVFENFLVANGWVLQTATQVTVPISSTSSGQQQQGNVLLNATNFPVLPFGAKASYSGFTGNAYLSNRETSTRYYLASDSAFATFPGNVNFNWQAYTKNGVTFLPIFTNYANHAVFGGDILKDINTPISVVGISNSSRRFAFQCIKFPTGSFPITYHIMYSENPTVFTIVFTFGVNQTYWLTFGMLDKIHPNAYVGGSFYSASDGFMIGVGARGIREISIDTSLNSINPSYNGTMLFNTHSDSAPSFILHAEINGLTCLDTVYGNNNPETNSVRLSANSIIKLFKGLNTWNGQTLLVPMEVEFRTSNGYIMLLGHVEHLRFLRIDNYNSGDIITLGSDKWKVFPTVKKDVPARNGASLDHSGTIGFAVRYDGA